MDSDVWLAIEGLMDRMRPPILNKRETPPDRRAAMVAMVRAGRYSDLRRAMSHELLAGADDACGAAEAARCNSKFEDHPPVRPFP